jgi:hypothetical protein
MRRVLLSAAALVVGLALVGSASAAPKAGPSSHHSYHDYHMTHGTKFKDGYFYKGHDHYHWTHRYWWGKYGCYTYYCPSSCCWYYWYQQDNCYYPCSYVGSATPVAETAPVGVPGGVTQIVNVNNDSAGAATGAPTPPVVPGNAGPPTR